VSRERRRHPRFQVSVAADVTFGPETFPGRLKDICRDAALVEVGHSLSLGDEVALSIALPGEGERLAIVGRVVRLADGDDGAHDAAVLFSDLTPTAETRIELFIAQQTDPA